MKFRNFIINILGTSVRKRPTKVFEIENFSKMQSPIIIFTLDGLSILNFLIKYDKIILDSVFHSELSN